MFAGNMNLQQKTKNAIWGWAEPRETVKVSFAEINGKTVIVSSGGSTAESRYIIDENVVT